MNNISDNQIKSYVDKVFAKFDKDRSNSLNSN